jgi:hypothetical protein
VNPSFSTDGAVRAALNQLPPVGPIADRAAALVATHQRCAEQACGEQPDAPAATPLERLDLVALYKRALLTALDTLRNIAQRSPVAEGGFR